MIPTNFVIPVVPKDLEKDIRAYGTFTGSRIFGGWDETKSDIDLLLPPHFPYSIEDLESMAIQIFDGTQYAPEIQFDSEINNFYTFYCRFMSNPNIYNILWAKTEKTYNYWILATKTMRQLKKIEIMARLLEIKKYRTALFEMILQSLKFRNKEN